MVVGVEVEHPLQGGHCRLQHSLGMAFSAGGQEDTWWGEGGTREPITHSGPLDRVGGKSQVQASQQNKIGAVNIKKTPDSLPYQVTVWFPTPGTQP